MAVHPTNRILWVYQERYNGENQSELQRNTNDERHWSFTDADFKETAEADWTTETYKKEHGN